MKDGEAWVGCRECLGMEVAEGHMVRMIPQEGGLGKERSITTLSEQNGAIKSSTPKFPLKTVYKPMVGVMTYYGNQLF